MSSLVILLLLKDSRLQIANSWKKKSNKFVFDTDDSVKTIPQSSPKVQK